MSIQDRLLSLLEIEQPRQIRLAVMKVVISVDKELRDEIMGILEGEADLDLRGLTIHKISALFGFTDNKASMIVMRLAESTGIYKILHSSIVEQLTDKGPFLILSSSKTVEYFEVVKFAYEAHSEEKIGGNINNNK